MAGPISQIIGTGSYLPERIVTNHDLAQKVDTSDEWIVERDGDSAASQSPPTAS